MGPDRRHTIAALSGRSFATFPAAVVVPIVNRREELLLLESPHRPGWWEPVNGAVDEGETLLEAALRELLGTIQAGTSPPLFPMLRKAHR